MVIRRSIEKLSAKNSEIHSRAEYVSNQKFLSEGSASSEELNDTCRARSCWYCKELGHVQQFCKKFGRLKHTYKIRFVMDKNLCFVCLKKGHFKSDCKTKVKCSKCRTTNHLGFRHRIFQKDSPV